MFRSAASVVERQRAVVEGHTLGGQVVRAHDGGVAPRSAAAQIALVDNGNVGDAVVGCQVVGGGKAMNAAANNDHVVGRLEVMVSPHPWPVLTGQALLRQRRRAVANRTRIRFSKRHHALSVGIRS